MCRTRSSVSPVSFPCIPQPSKLCRATCGVANAIPPRARGGAFFVFDRGQSATTPKVEYAFRTLRQRFGWRSRGGLRYPRIHDIRHTVATRRLERWYRAGADIDRGMLALSTYLGHTKVTDSYWYVTATPELMALAARRAERTGAMP